MKRVFQWKRYLDWKSLSCEEKMATKRLLFLPIIAYFISNLIHEYAFLFTLSIIIYLAYIKIDKKKLK